MLDFTYAGLLRRSGLTTPVEPLTAALEALRGSQPLAVDRAAPAWVTDTVAAWAVSSARPTEELVKVGGRPVEDGHPVLVCVPDRVGLIPRPGWQPDHGIVVTHRFSPDGTLAGIEIGPTVADPGTGRLRRGRDLAKRLRQVAGAVAVTGAAGPWCSYLQPDDPTAVLACMRQAGIRAGDPLDLAELAGGVAAIVPEHTSDTDLARYIDTLAAALSPAGL